MSKFIPCFFVGALLSALAIAESNTLQIHFNNSGPKSFAPSQIDSVVFIPNSSSSQAKSSSTIGSSSSILLPPEPVFGSLTDTRDGKNYRTVTIGKQIWMAQNLAYAAPGSTWTQGDSTNYSAFGRLYTWASAMNGAMGVHSTKGIQGICPTGWHLPTFLEWSELIDYASLFLNKSAGKNLSDSTSWSWYSKGKDIFGFAAMSAGVRDTTGSKYLWFGTNADFWTCTGEDFTSSAHKFEIYEGLSLKKGGLNKKYGLSVRCVAD